MLLRQGAPEMPCLESPRDRAVVPDAPPRFVRARLYRYRFTTPAERRETGAWWSRTLIGEYTPPVTLRGRAA
jgi:hypothetical protein